jgi:hypothetical protein
MKFLLLPFFRTCQLVCLHSCSSFERLHAFFSIAFFLSCASLFFDSWLTRKNFYFFYFFLLLLFIGAVYLTSRRWKRRVIFGY